MKHLFVFFPIFFIVLFLSGCIESSNTLTVASDGSCSEVRSFNVKTLVSDGRIDSKLHEAEKDGYEVIKNLRKDEEAEIIISKKYETLEDYYNSVDSFSELDCGSVSGKATDFNLFVFRKITITETVSPLNNPYSPYTSEAFKLVDKVSDAMITEKRIIKMPFKISSSNADSINESENSAEWITDSERRESGYVRQVSCVYINYPLLIIITLAAAFGLLALQRRKE